MGFYGYYNGNCPFCKGFYIAPEQNPLFTQRSDTWTGVTAWKYWPYTILHAAALQLCPWGIPHKKTRTRIILARVCEDPTEKRDRYSAFLTWLT